MENKKYTMSHTVPTTFRTMTVECRFADGTTQEDMNTINAYLASKQDEIAGKLHYVQIIDIITAFTDKMNPLTPYEREIIFMYETFHKDMARVCTDIDSSLALAQTITKQASELLKQIALVRKEYDEIISRHTTFMRDKEDPDVIQGATHIDIAKSFHEKLTAKETEVIAMETAYTEWTKQQKKTEERLILVSDKLRSEGMPAFTAEFYDEQERFTLDCVEFSKDYAKMIKDVQKQENKWKQHPPIYKKLFEGVEAVRKANKELIEHMETPPDSNFKQQAN